MKRHKDLLNCASVIIVFLGAPFIEALSPFWLVMIAIALVALVVVLGVVNTDE